MKFIYKLVLVNSLIAILIIFILYPGKKWYRGKIDFFVDMNKPSVNGIANPDFLLKEDSYKLIGKILSSREFRHNFIKKLNCLYLKNCYMIVSWKYKRRAIHNFHMEFIADNLKYVKKALELYPIEAYRFLNEKNKDVLESQVQIFEKNMRSLYNEILAVENKIKKIYMHYQIQNEYMNLINTYFRYLKEYLNLKRKEVLMNIFANEQNVNKKILTAKEMKIRDKLSKLEDTIFNSENNFQLMKINFLKSKLNILTEKYIKQSKELAFYRTLMEKKNIYYLFITDIKVAQKPEKPNYMSLFFWWLTFNIFLVFLFILLNNIKAIKD